MDVGAWLRGLDLGQYEQAFRDNDVDTGLLPTLTADDLRELGVAKVGDRYMLPEMPVTPRQDFGALRPFVSARLTAGTEFFGGLLVLLGLGTRLASLPLAFTMVIAIVTAKRASIDGITALVGFEEWSYLVFFIWIALVGAGPLSLDALIARVRGARGLRTGAGRGKVALRTSPGIPGE